MVICPKCNYKNRPNALYCTYCETWLADSIEAIANTTIRKGQIRIDERLLNSLPEISPIEGKLALVIEGVTVTLETSRVITLGRDTPQNPIKATLDLTPFGAYQKGVSRRHAEISFTHDQQLVLVDLGSSNGTYLNVERLVPHQQYILHDGDQICLAELVISVHYQSVDEQISGPKQSPSILKPDNSL